MKKRNISKTTIALFVAAILLAGTGAIGTRAMINSISSDYVAGFTTDGMNVTLVENDKTVASQSGKLFSTLDTGSDGEKTVIPGKEYGEKLQVRNTSNADQFVRVIVRKYWLKADQDGKYNKDLTKDPALIILTSDGGDWEINAEEETTERSVYYYTKVLSSEDDNNLTSPLITSVKVDGKILDEYETYTEKVNGKTATVYYYAYDGCIIGLEVEAQAVQTHSAADAINSVWGVKSLGISVDGDTLKVDNPGV